MCVDKKENMVKVIGLDESGDFETVRRERRENAPGGRTNYVIDQAAMFEDIRFLGGYTFPVEKEQFEAVKQGLEEVFKSVCRQVEKQCHQDTVDDAGLLAICERLKLQPTGVPRNYHVVFPLSLHGNTEPGTSKVFFKFFRNGYYTSLKLTDESQEARDNLSAWERLFGEYLEEQVIAHIKEKQGKLFCYLYPNVVLDAEKDRSLYETMAAHVVKNEFFNGTDKIYSGYAWEIATRVIPVEESNEQNRNIHLERYEQKWRGSERYTITNLDTYRTLLREILAGAKDSDLGVLVQDIQEDDFKEDIKSIKYFNTETIERLVDGRRETVRCMTTVSDQESTPFHYAADVVCSVIRSALQKQKWIPNMRNGKSFGILERVADGIAKKYGIDAEIRIYGEQDETLIRMIHAVQNAELHTYFDLCYELQDSGNGFSRFYVNRWLPKLDEMLRQKMEKKGYAYQNVDDAIRLLDYYMMTDYRQYPKGTYITEQFFERVFGWQLRRANESFKINEKLPEIPKEKYFAFILHLLRGYNHRGAAREPQKIIDWVDRSGILKELYPQGELNYYNVCLQYYFNSLQYEKVLNEAFNLSLRASDSVQGLSKLTNKENPLVKDNKTEQARIFSSAGQACGFLLAEDRYDHVLEKIGIGREMLEQAGSESYQNALQLFDELGQTGNYGITMSHYLQYLCLLGEKKGYEKYAERYFGSEKIPEQLEKALTNDLYYLRVFVKAMETFYKMEEFVPAYLEKITGYVEQQKDKTHPMELIETDLCKIRAAWGNGKIDMEDAMYKRVVTPMNNEEDVILLIRFHLKLNAILQHHPDWKSDPIMDHMDRYGREGMDRFQNITVDDLHTVNLFGKVMEKRAEEMTFEEMELFLDAKLAYEYC